MPTSIRWMLLAMYTLQVASVRKDGHSMQADKILPAKPSWLMANDDVQASKISLIDVTTKAETKEFPLTLTINDVVYTEFELAGEGTFGQVWKASNGAGEKVALKFPKKDAIPRLWKTNAAGKDVEMTIEEILNYKCERLQRMTEDVLTKNSDAHIMHCLSVGDLDGDYYSAYEWAGSDGLKTIQEGDPEYALGLLKQVILALYAMQNAKQHSYIHHDLKWQNVAVLDIGDEKCLKLIDVDDYTIGDWGHRLGETPYSELYAPPEKMSHKNDFFCGLPLSAEPAETAKCPGAYTFDIYSAGAMACEACALDWMYYAQAFEAASSRYPALVLIEDMLMKADGGPLHDTISLYGLNTLLIQDDPRIWVDLDKHGDSLIQKVVKKFNNYATSHHDERARIKDSIVEKAIRRLNKCKDLGKEAIDKLQDMIHSKPKSRPTPMEVLNSKLLSGVQTNCAEDREEPGESDTLSEKSELDADPEDPEDMDEGEKKVQEEKPRSFVCPCHTYDRVFRKPKKAPMVRCVEQDYPSPNAFQNCKKLKWDMKAKVYRLNCPCVWAS